MALTLSECRAFVEDYIVEMRRRGKTPSQSELDVMRGWPDLLTGETDCASRVALDRDHAEQHYGKYSAGYNRGRHRSHSAVAGLVQEREEYRDLLKAIECWNETAQMLPAPLRLTLNSVLWGEEL